MSCGELSTQQPDHVWSLPSAGLQLALPASFVFFLIRKHILLLVHTETTSIKQPPIFCSFYLSLQKLYMYKIFLYFKWKAENQNASI